jgi:uncharacterized protein YhaN
MRLNCLELTRYGKFTDGQIDFGEPLPGKPDLHIVYGPNEAGKSTAFSAFLDLLFGIERSSKYAFLHEKTMLVGADLSLGGVRTKLKRIKANQNNLLDENDRPAFGGPLASELGNLTRSTYATIFSLDDKVLENGGEEIIKSRGDLGQLLYAASAGLSDLSKKLDAIRGRTEEIFKKGGSKNKIAELKGKLNELRAKKDGIDTLAAEYKRLLGERDRMRGRHEAARIDLAANKGRLRDISRLLNAYTHLSALRRDRGLLADTPDYPDPPPAWYDRIVSLQTEETESRTLRQATEAEIKLARESLAGIAVDEDVLRVEARLDQLEQLKAKFIAAEKDLPSVTEDMKRAEAETAAILIRLERPDYPDPRSLILPISVESALQALIESRTKLDEKKSAAESEKTKADANLSRAQLALTSIGDAGSRELSAATQSYVSSLLAELRKSTFSAQIKVQTKNIADYEAKLRSQMPALHAWLGGAKDLVPMAVPTAAELQRLKAELSKTQQEFDKAESELTRLTAEHSRLVATRDALAGLPGVAEDRLAQQVREARDQAWTTHRQSLDSGTADNFETTLRRDDEVTASRFAHAASVANATQATLEAASAESAVMQAKAARDVAQQTLETALAKVRQTIQARTPGVSTTLSLAQWEDWLSSREKAVQTWDLMETAQRELESAQSEKAALTEKIALSLSEIGLQQPDPDNLDRLVAAAQAVLDQLGEAKILRKAVADRDQDGRERAADLVKADTALSVWQTNWSEKCCACWIGEAGTLPDRGLVKAILKELPSLKASLDKAKGFQDRIEGMSRDKKLFVERIGQLANDLDVAHQPDQPLDTIALIQSRLLRAKTDRELFSAKEREITDAEGRLTKINSTISNLDATKLSMTDHFGVASLGEVADRLSKSKERTLRKEQVSKSETEILGIMGQATIEEAEAILDANNATELSQELVKVEADANELEQTLSASFADLTRAQDAVDKIGGDDVVARIEAERRVLQLDIEEHAKKYLKLRIGTLAAEQGLLRYREAHRSSMLTNASEAFQIISRGHYEGLSTQPNRDGEILIAKCSNGSTKYAEDLSAGTRLQLYLALRVAGYKELASTRPSLPFIADDIMESFDDFRAEEAFRLFAEMAHLGQVIYLTHHRHLLPIATAVCPDVRVHELPGP